MTDSTGKCDCGADLVELHGKIWCADTLARFRVLHGEPKPPSPPTSNCLSSTGETK